MKNEFILKGKTVNISLHIKKLTFLLLGNMESDQEHFWILRLPMWYIFASDCKVALFGTHCYS